MKKNKIKIEEPVISKARRRNAMLGAAFLMATSAVGPGFLTQTAVFTQELAASFAFVVFVTIVLDIGAQLNIWRIIAITRMKGQEIANTVFPGLGYVVAAFIVLGGLAFNIGNVAGGGLGFNALLGIDSTMGAVITGVIGIAIFVNKEAGTIVDHFVKVLGALMILLIGYVMVKTHPPYGIAAVRAVAPLKVDVIAIVTIVGGTVGGYITFAGGHRLLDAGISGENNLKSVARTSILGIIITTTIRLLLFLAVFGVVATGFKLDPANPPASVFQHAVGTIGLRIFGLVILCASVTSVVGAAYTSVSFLEIFHSSIKKHRNKWTVGFICFSTIVFAVIGKPVFLLVLAGALNGLILPLVLASTLLVLFKKSVIGSYKHPIWLTVLGWFVFAVTACFGVKTLFFEIPKMF